MKRDDVPVIKELERYILRRYGVKGDYPFSDDFDDVAFRHADNRKWFALLIEVPKRLFFPLEGDGVLYLLSLKNDPKRVVFLYDEHIHPAYHMNKKNWISVLLDEGTDMALTKKLIDESYALTAKKKRKAPNHADF
jgi:predicted DNA-binding protein (MmcQ/YjbR family)